MHYKFVQNKKCQFFPCHQMKNEENFNCLFCYCPLFALKDECGGNPEFLEDGTKSCMNCTAPHNGPGGHDFVMKKIDKVLELGKK